MKSEENLKHSLNLKPSLTYTTENRDLCLA